MWFLVFLVMSGDTYVGHPVSGVTQVPMATQAACMKATANLLFTHGGVPRAYCVNASTGDVLVPPKP